MTYKVGNPRNIPGGTRILAFLPLGETDATNTQEWYEGDAFVKPAKMLAELFQDLVDTGLVVEVIDG